VELRHLRYFAAVAEELNFTRAAERLHIAGPTLSQQIKQLEREFKVRLFDRDRRRVVLTAKGAALLPYVRDLIGQAEELRRQAAGLSTGACSLEPVRIGYVNWYPADLAERAAAVAQLHVDSWVMPSHIQAARVAKGILDLAICRVEVADLERLDLAAELLGLDRLYAVGVGPDQSPVSAGRTLVLLDADGESWCSWNRFGRSYTAATGAATKDTDDGGITGPAFFEHIRRLRRPVLNSAMGHTATLPPDLVRRPIVDPAPLWPWSLVWRRDDQRAAVRALIEALTGGAACSHRPRVSEWLPSYRSVSCTCAEVATQQLNAGAAASPAIGRAVRFLTAGIAISRR
jgi:DNA-binding transcriptional LysR family regulator